MGQAIILNKSINSYMTSFTFFEEEVSWTFTKSNNTWHYNDKDVSDFANKYFEIKSNSQYLFRIIDKTDEIKQYVAQGIITDNILEFYYNDFEEFENSPIDIYITNNLLHLIDFNKISNNINSYSIDFLLIEVENGGSY